jgi:hypothetical protein
MYFFAALLISLAGIAGLGDETPAGVRAVATEYLESLRDTCPADPDPCTQKFQLAGVGDLERATIGTPWAAFVLQYSDFSETPFQDLLNVARFNYYACPIVVDGEYKGVVRVCTDPDLPEPIWKWCGSRGPARVAEVNAWGLTLAPPEDSLTVVCMLTVENNSRYIITRQKGEYFIIAASDMGADLMGKNVRHVSRKTMFPLAEALYQIDRSVKQRHTPAGKR